MLTLSMLLALRRLFSQTMQGINEVPVDNIENRKDAKRPRFKVKKKNLERISRIERRLDVWEDVAISFDPKSKSEVHEHSPLHQCASSTQTNATAPQSAASMQTEPAVMCSLAVQTQWIAMPTTMQKLHVERPDQRDISLQTDLLGIDMAMQTEREEKSVYMQTEHRVFVFQTVSIQTEPVEMYDCVFETEAAERNKLKGFEMETLPEVEVQKPVKVALKFMTIPKETSVTDQCDVELPTRCLAKNISIQTDSHVLVLQTNWVQTDHAIKCDLAVQTDITSEIGDKIATQEYAAQTDAIEQRDAALQIEYTGKDIGLQTEMSPTGSKVQCDEANQTEFVGSDADVQTDRPLPNFVTQTKSIDNRDVAMQTNVSGNIENRESTTQTEEVSRSDIALQTVLVDSQREETHKEKTELHELAMQTDIIEFCNTAFQTEFLGIDATAQTIKPELPNLSTQTDIITLCDTSFQTEFVGKDATVQTVRPEQPNLATQTDLIEFCDIGFQTEFLGINATAQTVRPEQPNLATQTDLIAFCDTAFQTEIFSNEISTQTERLTHPEFSTQTDTFDKRNASLQTELNGRDISIQTQSAASPAKWTQTTSTLSCDSCLQTAFETRSISCQTEKRTMPTFSMQTEKVVNLDAGLQTDFVGNTVSTQTVPQTRPTFSMQTARIMKSDAVIQTEFAVRNVSVQTFKPALPSFSMQTEKAVRFGRGMQTEFLVNDVSIQTERTIAPYLSLADEVDDKPRLRSELVGISTSMQTEVLTFPSFSTQTDLVVKSDSALQTEVSQRSVAIQTIKPRLPAFSIQPREIERHNRFSQTDLVDRSISLPNTSIAKEDRSCQTDFLLDAKIVTGNLMRRTRSSEGLSFHSQMDLTGATRTSETEEYDLKKIKATYATCTYLEKAHYLGILAANLLKWHETTLLDKSGKSYEEKIAAADKALLDIEQEFHECPPESGKKDALASAKLRVNDYLLRLKTQRNESNANK